MSHQNNKENELYEIRTKLNRMQNEWNDDLESVQEAREAIKSEDIFDRIAFLTLCDQLNKKMHTNWGDLEALFKYLVQIRKQVEPSKKNLDSMENMIIDIGKMQHEIKKRRDALEEEYATVSETTLQLTQDLIDKFSTRMQSETRTPTLKTEISQNLEKELFLQELKDSLELYREAREDYVSVLVNGIKLPENQIPEDLGEEAPEIDAILSQLDTAITSCDFSLLKKQTSDE